MIIVPITPREAHEQGLNRYFTGASCKNGHVAERYLTNGRCVECTRQKAQRWSKENYERVKAWRAAHPNLREARAAEARKWRAKHPEVAAAIKKRHREAHLDDIRTADRLKQAHWRKQYPEAQKARELRTRERMRAKQEELAGRPRAIQCEVIDCGAISMTVFDHCHATNQFRGWICDRCNKVLGLVYENPTLLRSLGEYLESFNDRVNCRKKEIDAEIGLCGPRQIISS